MSARKPLLPIPVINFIGMVTYTLFGMVLLRWIGLPERLPLPVWVAWLLGFPVLLVGLALILIALRRLGFQRAAGAEFFPSVGDVPLETSGMFACTRNPMYLAGIIIFIGLAIWLRWTPLLFAALLVTAHVTAVGKWEERELTERYGDAYRQYRDRVPFLVPRVRRKH